MFKSVKTRSYKEHLEQEDKAIAELKEIAKEYCEKDTDPYSTLCRLFPGSNWVTPHRLSIRTLSGHPKVAVELSYGDFSLEEGTHQVMLGVTFRDLDGDCEVEEFSTGSRNITDIISALNAAAAFKNAKPQSVQQD